MKTKPQLHSFPFLITLGLILLSSCKNPSSETIDDKNDSTLNAMDTMNIALNDTQSEELVDTVADKKVFEDADTQEAHEEIVKKYGKQWDLCTCIIKSDSVNEALMNASDDEFDAVMERSNYIDLKCKDMLIHPNETPEDRYKYEKKVNDCLDQAKK